MPFLHHALRLYRLLFALVADLSWLLLAVLRVTVFLCFLGTSLHFKLAYLLWLEVTVLFFDRKGEDIREFLTIPVYVGLAYFHLDLSGNVIAVLLRFPCADNLFLSISVGLCGLLASTVKLDSVSAGDVVDDLLLHEAVWRLDITALVIIFSGGVYLVGSVTDAIFASEASLYLICFFERFVVNSFHKITNQFIDIKANAFDISFNDSSAILEELGLTNFLVLGPASLLLVRLALIIKHYFLDLVTVWILVHSITSNIRLSNIRIIFLSGSRRRIFLRNCWRRTKDSYHKTAREDESLHVIHSSCFLE